VMPTGRLEAWIPLTCSPPHYLVLHFVLKRDTELSV
jgi:hypothetical protein